MSTAEKQTSQVIPMPSDKKEFHRIKYSLKMALRVINGRLEDFNVHQYGTSGLNLEDEHEMTTVESWYKTENHNEVQTIERDWNLPFENGYQTIRTGTIIKGPADIKDGE